MRQNDVLKAENAGCIGSGELSLALSIVILIEPDVSSELRTEIEDVEAPRGLGGSYSSVEKPNHDEQAQLTVLNPATAAPFFVILKSF